MIISDLINNKDVDKGKILNVNINILGHVNLESELSGEFVSNKIFDNQMLCHYCPIEYRLGNKFSGVCSSDGKPGRCPVY